MQPFTREELEQIAAFNLLASEKAAEMIQIIDAKSAYMKEVDKVNKGLLKCKSILIPWESRSNINARQIDFYENGIADSSYYNPIASRHSPTFNDCISPSGRRKVKVRHLNSWAFDDKTLYFKYYLNICKSCYCCDWSNEKTKAGRAVEGFFFGSIRMNEITGIKKENKDCFDKLQNLEYEDPVKYNFCHQCSREESRPSWPTMQVDGYINWHAKRWVLDELSKRRSLRRPKAIRAALVDIGEEIEEAIQEPKHDVSSYLYVMKCAQTKRYKIGVSVNPQYREKTLQSAQPDITLVAQFAGMAHLEKAWHNYYAQHRARGEWFNLTEQQVRWMVSLCRKGEEHVRETLDKVV